MMTPAVFIKYSDLIRRSDRVVKVAASGLVSSLFRKSEGSNPFFVMFLFCAGHGRWTHVHRQLYP